MYSKLITGYYRDARRASLPSLHHRWSLGICTNKKTSHIVYPNTWFTPSPPGDPHSFTHSPIHPFTHSLIHSFTHCHDPHPMPDRKLHRVGHEAVFVSLLVEFDRFGDRFLTLYKHGGL